MATIRFTVNGKAVSTSAAGDKPLLWVLREDLAMTGTKSEDKRYFRHTLYPGGAYWVSIRTLMQEHPERVVTQAVRGMMPRTKLGRAMIKKLRVYAGPDHPHQAQQPKALAVNE